MQKTVTAAFDTSFSSNMMVCLPDSKTLQVYDVTSYVEEHPGGDAILAHAGDDSTEGFYGYASVFMKRICTLVLHSFDYWQHEGYFLGTWPSKKGTTSSYNSHSILLNN